MEVNNLEQLYNAVQNDEPIIILKNGAKRIVESNMTEEYHQFRQYNYYKPRVNYGMDFVFEVIVEIADFFDRRKLSKSQRKKIDLENQKINEIVEIISKYYYISSKGHSYIELEHDGEWSVSVKNINIIK